MLLDSKQQSPIFLAPGIGFVGDIFSMRGGAGFGMTQAHYVYCAHTFCYFDLSSDAGGQAQILEVGPPLLGHGSLTWIPGGLLRAHTAGPLTAADRAGVGCKTLHL